MSDGSIFHGSNAVRTLQASGKALDGVIFQKRNPPLAAELNAIGTIQSEARAEVVRAVVPSGFLGDPLNPERDYQFDPRWSNFFVFGRQDSPAIQNPVRAIVNGWVLNVAGTNTPQVSSVLDLRNRIHLTQASMSLLPRNDFVFLEAFLARVPAGNTETDSNITTITQGTPSGTFTTKPAHDKLYRYGNRAWVGSQADDEMIDPRIAKETTQRMQVQYRIRVVDGVNVLRFADGFDREKVFARGAANTPTTYIFENMADELGDPGLWRAGDGSEEAKGKLGTADGYVYAIPICAVRRRNRGGFASSLASGVDRQHMATTVPGFVSSPLILPPSAKDGGPAGSSNPSNVESDRADGLFADQVVIEDITDLRHLVSPNGWDYQSILEANVKRLVDGTLRTTPRTTVSDVGVVVNYKDKIDAIPSPGTTGDAADNSIAGFNGVRRWFSDVPLPEVDVFTTVNPTTTGTLVGKGAQYTILFPANMPTGARFLTTRTKVSLENRDDLAVQFRATSPGPGQQLVLHISGVFLRDPTTGLTGGSHLTGFNDRLWVDYTVAMPPGNGLSRRPDRIDKVIIRPETTDGGSILAPNDIGTPTGPREITPQWVQFNPDVNEHKGIDPDGFTGYGYFGKELRASDSYFDLGSKTLSVHPWRAQDVALRFQQVSGVGLREHIRWGATAGNANLQTLVTNFVNQKYYTNLPQNLAMGWGRQDLAVLKGAAGAFYATGLYGPVLGGQPTAVAITARTSEMDPRLILFQTHIPEVSGGSLHQIAYGAQGVTTLGQTKFNNAMSVGIRFNPEKGGFEFPPYIGIARVKGVYRWSELNTTPTPNVLAQSKNYLKGNDKDNPVGRSLWINRLKLGSTEFPDVPTFTILPDAVEDYTENNGWVVIAEVFGFADGFLKDNARVFPDKAITISPNNVVEAYLSGGDHSFSSPKNNPKATIQTRFLTNKTALRVASTADIHYTRTVYQGDAYYDDLIPGNDTPAGSLAGGGEPASTFFRNRKTALNTVSDDLNDNLLIQNLEFAEVLAHGVITSSIGTGRFSGHGVTNFQGFYTGASVEAQVDALGPDYKGTVGKDLNPISTAIAGLSTRLPLGINLRDYEFVGENVESDKAFIFRAGMTNPPVDLVDVDGQRTYGEWPGAGTYIATTKGSAEVNQQLVYRALRGASGFVEGGSALAVELAENPATMNHFVTVAFLVRSVKTIRPERRNLPVSSTNPFTVLNAGEELQIILVTGLGNNVRRFLTSPVGLGEGDVAVTRYRCIGRPLDRRVHSIKPQFTGLAGAKGTLALDTVTDAPNIVQAVKDPVALTVYGVNFGADTGSSVVTVYSPTDVAAPISQVDIEGAPGGLFTDTDVIVPASLLATAVPFTIAAGSTVQVTADGVDSARATIYVVL